MIIPFYSILWEYFERNIARNLFPNTKGFLEISNGAPARHAALMAREWQAAYIPCGKDAAGSLTGALPFARPAGSRAMTGAVDRIPWAPAAARLRAD